MPRFRRTVSSVSFIVSLLIVLVGLTQAIQFRQSNQASGPLHEATIFRPGETHSPMPTPIPTAVSQTTIPPVTAPWTPLPPCTRSPQDLAYWQRYFYEDLPGGRIPAAVLIQRVRRLSPSFTHLDAATLRAWLNTPDSASLPERIRQLQALLWLNVVAGNLNRTTALRLAHLPQIRTVADLLERLEQEAPLDTKAILLAAGREVLADRALKEHVCAQVRYMRPGMTLKASQAKGEIRWTENGMETRFLSPAFAPEDAVWMLDRWSPAPDYRRAAIETFTYESGGPVLIWDLTTGAVTNLNERAQLSLDDRGPNAVRRALRAPWRVIGWSDRSQQLILTIEGASLILAVDIDAGSYRTFTLEKEGQVIAGRAYMDVAPDRDVLLFRSHRPESGQQELQELDLDTGQTIAVATLEAGQRLYNPRYAPDGIQIAYIVEEGDPATGVTTSLRVLDRASGVERVVAKGKIGRVEPSWSPDSRWIAFPWTAVEQAEGYPLIPNAEGWQGNIWLVSAAGDALQQVTFMDGGALAPIWSLDGEHLAFVTHAGEIGLVDPWSPGSMWRLLDLAPQQKVFAPSFFYIP